MAEDEERSRKMKVVLVGPSKSGKSALLECYGNKRFAEGREHEATIGVNLFTKKVGVQDTQNVELSLWDTAGRTEALPIPIDTYFRGAAAVLLVRYAPGAHAIPQSNRHTGV